MVSVLCFGLLFFFFFNDTATTEIYTLSLHDALPFSGPSSRYSGRSPRLSQRRMAIIVRSARPGFSEDGGGNGKLHTISRLRLSRIKPPSPSNIRARVLVGRISVFNTGATRSGLIEKLRPEYSSGAR